MEEAVAKDLAKVMATGSAKVMEKELEKVMATGSALEKASASELALVEEAAVVVVEAVGTGD